MRETGESRKAPIARPTMLDRAIAWAAPVYGARRMAARAAMAMAGGYHGGSLSRASLRRWKPGGGSATADINPDLPDLRARSRDLARNAPVAVAAVNTSTTHVVGGGLMMQPRIDRERLGLSEAQAAAWEADTRREWRLWSESRLCDANQTLAFNGQQALAFRSAFESGDVFALLPMIEKRGFPYRLSVQIIEADRVSNPAQAADRKRLAGGVEMDINGAPVAYHITSSHPGDYNRSALKWYRWPVRGAKTGRLNVLHLFEKRRPGQVRGVPELAPVIEALKQLDQYTEAELQAAVIAGAFSVFVKMDPEAFDSIFDDDAQRALIDSAKNWDGTIEAGKAVNLLPGEEIETANPGRPNDAFDPFVTAIVRQIGMALEIPYEVLIMHFQSSYSAARGALLQAWRMFRRRRRWLAAYFCQPIYEEWLAEAVSIGRIAAPGFFADPAIAKAWSGAQWIGDGPGSIDPLKEVNAAEKRLQIGITTLDAESVNYDGVPWEQKHRQQVIERAARDSAGLAGKS